MEEFPKKINTFESREKPPVLYHGTWNNDIEEFVPLPPQDGDERPDTEPSVYASPDIEIAIQSMANKFVSNGGILNGRKFVCIPMSQEEFLAQDTGGTVYAFASDSFEMNKGVGLDEKEWVSKTSVKPESKQHFPSLFEALQKNRTEMYFIKPEMVSVITQAQKNDSPEELEKILSELIPAKDSSEQI